MGFQTVQTVKTQVPLLLFEFLAFVMGGGGYFQMSEIFGQNLRTTEIDPQLISVEQLRNKMSSKFLQIF